MGAGAGRKKVLLIDDNVSYCKEFVEAAKKHDLEAVYENQGSAAEERTRAVEPDLVVIDWGMTLHQTSQCSREQDGVVIARSLRRVFPELPIIVISVFTDLPDEVGDEFPCVIKKVAEELFNEIDKVLR